MGRVTSFCSSIDIISVLVCIWCILLIYRVIGAIHVVYSHIPRLCRDSLILYLLVYNHMAYVHQSAKYVPFHITE